MVVTGRTVGVGSKQTIPPLFCDATLRAAGVGSSESAFFSGVDMEICSLWSNQAVAVSFTVQNSYPDNHKGPPPGSRCILAFAPGNIPDQG